MDYTGVKDEKRGIKFPMIEIQIGGWCPIFWMRSWAAVWQPRTL